MGVGVLCQLVYSCQLPVQNLGLKEGRDPRRVEGGMYGYVCTYHISILVSCQTLLQCTFLTTPSLIPPEYAIPHTHLALVPRLSLRRVHFSLRLDCGPEAEIYPCGKVPLIVVAYHLDRAHDLASSSAILEANRECMEWSV